EPALHKHARPTEIVLVLRAELQLADRQHARFLPRELLRRAVVQRGIAFLGPAKYDRAVRLAVDRETRFADAAPGLQRERRADAVEVVPARQIDARAGVGKG